MILLTSKFNKIGMLHLSFRLPPELHLQQPSIVPNIVSGRGGHDAWLRDLTENNTKQEQGENLRYGGQNIREYI